MLIFGAWGVGVAVAVHVNDHDHVNDQDHDHDHEGTCFVRGGYDEMVPLRSYVQVSMTAPAEAVTVIMPLNVEPEAEAVPVSVAPLMVQLYVAEQPSLLTVG